MKNFEDVYKELMDNDAKKFMEKRKKINIAAILGVLIFVLLYIFIFPKKIVSTQAMNLITILFIILIVVYFVIFNKYAKEYKKKIIGKFLKHINETFDIYPEKGIDRNSYAQTGFKLGNSFNATDLIVGKLENNLPVEISDIIVKNITKDKNDGRRYEEVIFKGLFLKVNFKKNISKPIMLVRNEVKLMKNNLKIDNSEFEKYYDIYAENEIQALQLYTLDVMERILNFKEKTKLYPEIIVKNNSLYMRIAAEQLFEPTAFDLGFDKNRLEQYYEIVKLADDISNHLLNTIIDEIL